MEFVHPADVLVGDPAGQLDLIPKAVNGPLIQGNIGVEDFEGDFLADFSIEGTVDAAHAAFTQLLDDLVSASKGRTRDQLIYGHPERLCLRDDEFFSGREWSRTFGTEFRT
jgi:hypothetical protein